MNPYRRPERLFRYFPPAASDFFSAKKLWMSAVRDYNDPFDALPRFDTMLEAQSQDAIKKEFAFLPPNVNWNWPAFKKVMSNDAAAFISEGVEAVSEKHVEEVSERLRSVCFFAGNIDKLRMWSHYASSHTGFVVEFDPNHRMFRTVDFEKVHYECERLEVEGTNSEDLGRMLFTKSDEWIDEDEWRLARTASTLPSGKRRDGKAMRYFELPTDSICAVYFGCRILVENCVELLEALQKDEWKNVKKFIMRPHETEYAIVPILWDQWRDKPNTFRAELDRLIPKQNVLNLLEPKKLSNPCLKTKIVL